MRHAAQILLLTAATLGVVGHWLPGGGHDPLRGSALAAEPAGEEKAGEETGTRHCGRGPRARPPAA